VYRPYSRQGVRDDIQRRHACERHASSGRGDPGSGQRVIVFTGLAAYDAQRLKAMAQTTPEGQIGSYAIVGSLALYLDFINLFLFLLRFTGSRRD
jgi:hypothetical protein